jgi:DNA-binding response OmpR family regulator
MTRKDIISPPRPVLIVGDDDALRQVASSGLTQSIEAATLEAHVDRPRQKIERGPARPLLTTAPGG